MLCDCLRNTDSRLVAACDIDPDKLDRFSRRYHIDAGYSDFREMLEKEDLDAVICVQGPDLHYDVAKACLEKGIPVFVEKTPCRTAAQARELADLQRDGVFAMTGFNRRFAIGYVMAKKIISSEEFGEKTMYLAKYNASSYKSEEFYIFNHIVHHIDLARFLCGEIDITHADRVRVSDTQVGFHVCFRARESNLIGTIQSGSLQYIEYPMERVEITGVRTNVIVDNIKRLEYNRPTTQKRNAGEAVMRDGFDTLSWNHNHGNLIENDLNGFKDEIEHFIDCVKNKITPAETFSDSVFTMETLEKLGTLLS